MRFTDPGLQPDAVTTGIPHKSPGVRQPLVIHMQEIHRPYTLAMIGLTNAIMASWYRDVSNDRSRNGVAAPGCAAAV